MKILVSSCLLGDNTKYNGGNNKKDDLIKFLENHEVIRICPEVMGGMKTPREPSEILDGRVINKKQENVTDYFVDGARKVLDIARKEEIDVAILKKNSPSCGYGIIYDGTFTGKKIKGNGVTAEMLNDNGVIILNEDNYQEYFKKVC